MRMAVGQSPTATIVMLVGAYAMGIFNVIQHRENTNPVAAGNERDVSVADVRMQQANQASSAKPMCPAAIISAGLCPAY